MTDPAPPPSRFARWSQRKASVRRGEEIADEEEADEEEEATTDTAATTDEEAELAELDDAELLERYGLPDPQKVKSGKGLEGFFAHGIPDRLRQMALRRLWHINPAFRVVDDMVEYGEDYTDAATVIDGMKSAYEVGKGYLEKIRETEAENARKAEELAMKRGDNYGEEVVENKEKTGDEKDAENESDSAENSSENMTPDSQDSLGDSQGDSPDDSNDSQEQTAAMRPMRPQFRKK